MQDYHASPKKGNAAHERCISLATSANVPKPYIPGMQGKENFKPAI